MFISQEWAYPTTYSIELRVMPDPSNDIAVCTPAVAPQSGVLTSKPVPLDITYNCGVSIGRGRIFMGFTVNNTCKTAVVW